LQSDENDDENREDARQCQSYVVALLLFRKVHTMD
jgi:2-methylcitrate dehydratase PrpD